MALANFFDRAATAASQILSNFDRAAFETLLGDEMVGLTFDGSATRSIEGDATLDLTIRLLARLYPKLAVLPLDAAAAPRATTLRRLAKSINPDVNFARSPKRMTVCLVVGDTRPPVACPTVFIGSEGWRAKLSRSGPVGSGGSPNPFGAGAAACFGVANVFRMIFADQLAASDPDTAIDLSLLTYGPGVADGPELDLTGIDIGQTHLIGLGAIGNGAVWALARAPKITGALHLIDHETVELSNLQRYVLADQASREAAKVELAAVAFAGGTLKVTPHTLRWSAYVGARQDWAFERVAVALDTAADRIAVQGALPRWIVNAWTQDIDLGVSRHGFDDGRACLACLYLPDRKLQNEDEQIADELRLPEARLEIRTLLQTNAPIDLGFTARVAQAFGVPPDKLAHFVGQSVRTLHQKAICGGLLMQLTGGAQAAAAVVPMAFQSALAGILLAAELLKHAGDCARPPTTSTRINQLRPLASYLHDPRAKDASGRCLCADLDFIAAYRRKYLGLLA